MVVCGIGGVTCRIGVWLLWLRAAEELLGIRFEKSAMLTGGPDNFAVNVRVFCFEDCGYGPFDVRHLGLPREDEAVFGWPGVWVQQLRRVPRALVCVASGSRSFARGDFGGPGCEECRESRGVGTPRVYDVAWLHRGLLSYEGVSLLSTVHGEIIACGQLDFRCLQVTIIDS